MVFKEVNKILCKNGWYNIRTKGSHYQYKHSNFPSCVTVPNHGSKEISIGVIKNLEKATGLSLR